MPKTFKTQIERRLKSFNYAFKGLAFVVRTQTNMQIHLIATAIVIVAGIFFKINSTQWLFIILAIALVLISEIINTAIEEIVNFISPEHNKKAGLIKDLGAAFVLLAAIFSVIVGIIIFAPKILLMF